jgi:cytidylate kinase
MINVITIDGPSGSGKGTIAKLLADTLGWHVLDSGAMYRMAALAVLRQQWTVENPQVPQLISSVTMQLHGDKAWLNDDDVSVMIRNEEIGTIASKLATLPAVRNILIAQQRAALKAPGLIADGRDMGTLIFPEAQLKIFLTASALERANRRYNQLKGQGLHVNLAELVATITDRDARDQNRAVAPLQAAQSAFTIDTTGINVATVFTQIMEIVIATFPDLRV